MTPNSTSPRKVLITGANRGIGLHLANHFLDQGWEVAGCGRSAAAIEHERYVHHQADVSNEQHVADLATALRAKWGMVDAVINNAGVARMVPVALTPASTAQKIMDVNFMGTFLVSNALLRLLRKSKSGRIVNLTTVAVPLRLEGEAIYAASKSAVETFTRVLAKEISSFGITCNAIGPTPIRTDLIKNVPNDKLNALVQRQAIKSWATCEDVANVVDFFLRPESSMISGQVLYLGGLG
ncbi:MAG: SDR family oxidoreductase [Planctomycetaceae bacterium]|nr:SDR family oxidoreductase [Planctomycetaceae bacterium]